MSKNYQFHSTVNVDGVLHKAGDIVSEGDNAGRHRQAVSDTVC